MDPGAAHHFAAAYQVEPVGLDLVSAGAAADAVAGAVAHVDDVVACAARDQIAAGSPVDVVSAAAGSDLIVAHAAVDAKPAYEPHTARLSVTFNRRPSSA